MESSYKKLSKLRDETVYQIKKAMETRKIHAKTAANRIEKGLDAVEVYDNQNLQNAITLDELLDALGKLYEIE